MGRRRVEKNPIRRQRLIQLMSETGVSQAELSRRTGIAQQNISRMVQESDYQNLTETNAKAIIEVFPQYRLLWLLGFDDFKTKADESAFRLRGRKDKADRMRVLFELLAQSSGWDFENYDIAAPVVGRDGDWLDFSSSSIAIAPYIETEKDGVAVEFTKIEFEQFAQKILDYFEFELLHHINAHPAQSGKHQ